MGSREKLAGLTILAIAGTALVVAAFLLSAESGGLSRQPESFQERSARCESEGGWLRVTERDGERAFFCDNPPRHPGFIVFDESTDYWLD